MRTLLVIALLASGILPGSIAAGENSNPETTNVVSAHGSRAVVNSSSQTQRASNSAQARYESRRPHVDDQGSVVVDVWSSAETDQKLSPAFATAALSTASRLQNTERRIEESIKRGFPLGAFWIESDFDGIEDSLRVASLAVTSDADHTALQQLQGETDRLRTWSEWLIEQNRQLRLADYYMSPSKLDDDEQFQSSVACTNYLLSMLSSGKLEEEDRSCR